MARTPFDEMNCSIARTLAVIGDSWTPLILRDIALGITRFDGIQRDLGISRKVLAARLSALVEDGVLERKPYQEKPLRYDYFPTPKGAELAFVLLAMRAWGDRWTFGDEGPPILVRHDTCGATINVVPACSCCGEPLRVGDLTPLPGPSAAPGPGGHEIMAAVERLAARASS